MTFARATRGIGRRIAARFGPGAVSDVSHGTVTADVAAQHWAEALSFARDDLGCDVFDWLSALDELADGFAIVAHLYSKTGGQHLLLRTRICANSPRLPTVVEVYRAAAAYEREITNAFGIRFDGHPDSSAPLP